MREASDFGTAVGARSLTGIVLLAAAAFLPVCAGSQEVAAVLSKGSGPYLETFTAFQEAYGRPVFSYDLSKGGLDLPDGVKVAAAFGVRAAAFQYAGNVRVIYAITPGLDARKPGKGFTGIPMLPAPAEAAAVYKSFQPGLKRLAVFLAASGREDYLIELASAARGEGIEIIPSRLSGPGAFPSRLRALIGKMDAFWLLPDAEIIDKAALRLLADFSCANALPFYAPSSGLVELGATASFAPGFAASGKAAALAVKKALAGETLPETIYVERSELTVNEGLAEKCGLPVKMKRAKQ